MRTSKLRPRVLDMVAGHPAIEIHVREAARRLGASPAATSAVLRGLELEGVLTSRWVGRNRVFRAAPRGTAPGVRRQMTAQFPALPEEWDLRPYFLWDRDLSWREFRDLIDGPDAARSAWAMGRLLDDARWPDIWHLVSPARVRRELPNIRVERRQVWRDLVGVDGAAG